MPLKRCTSNGKQGWKWGDSGKCYTGQGARSRALKQARAIEASKAENSDSGNSGGISLVSNVRRRPRIARNSDPTRTTTLRRSFRNAIRIRLRRARREVHRLIVEENALGLLSSPNSLDYLSTLNAEHNRGCVLLKIQQADVYENLAKLHSYIDEEDILKLENKPHITVLYGLLPEIGFDDVEPIVSRYKKFSMTIRELHVFQNEESRYPDFSILATKTSASSF